MKAGLPFAVLMLIMPALAWGTTLRLSPEVDLLVLDGKRVSGSLLKGAGRIEIDNGPHQLVLRVEKNDSAIQQARRPRFYPPLVVSFDSKERDQINIVLFRKEAGRMAISPHIQLLDNHAKPVPVLTDVLGTRPEPGEVNYEEETRRYNKAGKKASMPEFATLKTHDRKTYFTSANPGSLASRSEALTEQRLKYWYNRADKSTQARFLHWAKESTEQ